MATLQGDFAGPDASGALAVAKGGVATGTITGCWPSHTARFVLESSMDNGSTWRELTAFEAGPQGAESAAVKLVTPSLPTGTRVRIRCTSFRSGSASWTLAT